MCDLLEVEQNINAGIFQNAHEIFLQLRQWWKWNKNLKMLIILQK